jgi:predicted nucleic acid-binding protein
VGLILDTSVLLAALDGADPDHGRCADLIAKANENLLVPALVLSELDYWCSERLGSDVWLAFLEDVLAGAYSVEWPTQGDLERCLELQRTYAELRLGVVDASLLALAERLGEAKLATLDHRHFATMRPRHTGALELLPA